MGRLTFGSRGALAAGGVLWLTAGLGLGSCRLGFEETPPAEGQGGAGGSSGVAGGAAGAQTGPPEEPHIPGPDELTRVQLVCTEQTCACLAGQLCKVDCEGGNCPDINCFPGSRCDLVCRQSSCERVVCEADAFCFVDCLDNECAGEWSCGGEPCSLPPPP